jgi:class 3 adenylate cyclase
VTDAPRWKRLLEPVLSIGADPTQTEAIRGGRRVFIVAFILATLFSIPQAASDFADGYTWVAVMNVVVSIVVFAMVFAIWRRPRWFVVLVTLMFAVISVSQLAETAMFGGLFPSGLVVMFGLAFPLAALLAIGVRSALWWSAAFVASVVFAVAVPDWVDPIYRQTNPTDDAAFNLIATGVLMVAVVWYFVRQRDRFQQRSDDLLHNILPDEIAVRLKDDEGGTIADDVDAASVLFADVVGFTPMSETMSPAELVGLLDELFSAFDGFVAELGLEKIKTVGDAYMVAAGVPVPRSDHAQAIAELALRIRDHVATTPIAGRTIELRIGIASGPVTAGIIGTHKFAYDLWGDTVNTASRMESSGIPGSIQMTRATYERIEDRFVCEPRGPVAVKGKDEMETYLLMSRRADT